MLSTRPNVMPIVVTTGVGPAGKRTVHYQAPSEDEDGDESYTAPPQVFSPAQLQQFQTLQEALDAHAAGPLNTSFPDFFPSSFDLDFEKENFPLTPTLTPTPKQIPSNYHPTSAPPSTRTLKSFNAIEKAKQRISKLPKKRTFEDVLANLQQ